ncbi:EAL domain-containing protein [Achromobacter sp. F4_2707]|uniref:EAL domain-containing protein n=1 Tax=Achromobacter sp. F4_2707 TaxID=3114286 RepID=UPI0039C619DD
MKRKHINSPRLPAVFSRRPRFGIAQKIGVVFMALLLIALVNIMLVERMMTKSDNVADTVNVAGKLRMLGQRIALQTVNYGHGVGTGETEVRQLMGDFDTALRVLTDGGHAFGLKIEGLSDDHNARLGAVREQWELYQRSVHELLSEIQRNRDQTDGAVSPFSEVSGSLEPLLESVVGRSAGLLERTETLMNGILTDVEAAQAATMSRMYALVFVDVLLILLAFWVVRRQIVVPLRDLSTHCVELAAGNYNTRFEVSTQDEIGHLAKVFNESAGRIGSLVERIEQERHNLVRAEGMFRGIAENSMVGVYITQKGRFLYVNAKMAEMFGYEADEMVENVSSNHVFHQCEPVADEPAVRRRLGGEVPGLWMEKKGRRKDGTVIDLEIFGSMMALDDEPVTIGIALDVTRRKGVEAQARLAMLVYRHSSEAMVVTEPTGQLISVNPAFTKITGYEPEEVVGKKLNILSSGRHDAAFYQNMWAAINTTGCWEGDIWNRRKNGEIYAERLSVDTCYDDDGVPLYRIGLFSDITKQKEANAFIWKQANYDQLTGLPNRQLFQERLEKEIERSDATDMPMALVYLDIDDFKELNDTVGHDFGDKLLVAAAKRLQSCLRSSDTVARLGGDEFMLILGNLSDLASVDSICDKVMQRLAEPFKLEGEQAAISISMGITFYPMDGRSSKDLMQNADLAMFAAKARGKQQVARFLPSMQAHMNLRREMAKDLSVAVHEGQFHLAYQPIVELKSGRIDKVECLLRWQHPEKGLISPNVFVPFAEDTRLINTIGKWVFKKAAKQMAEWCWLRPGLQASINVSPVQFMDHELSSEAWLEHLAGLGLKGENLVVEITERLLMGVDGDVSKKLIAFRDAGVQIALDDFGTGYSSMSYLKRFDIDYIKIDQSFIRNLGRDSEDLVLCEAMIGMAHRLGLQVVAEGVETPLQRDLLLEAGCDFAQGYLFSPPVQAERFEELLRNGHIAPATSSKHQIKMGAFVHAT